MKPRRPRSDSAKSAVAAAQNAAQGPIAPPACVTLRSGDLPFWERVVSSKARDNWTDVDLVTAAQLARAYADIEMLQRQIDADGYILDGKVNPAAALLETLSKRTIALTRVLQVHCLATVGRSANSVKSAALERDARAHLDDDLIPTMAMMQ
ncbi:P27 family phage terminase small subunit [Stutzerimonas stutzeri]|uniref:P27 family phage terminase small subunit n=1 Tax=Stutzerimonas stutzeri TaxID=316 RepID=UPI0021096354|nr:P27 family phage terminase small subunit [Stutzerimonas stutzeri]MCQ4322895.1 P27 family phage terminase small subunit [Stutzerimonas stutzeri]